MEKTKVQHWAGLLRVFVRALMVCNFVVLFLVPSLVLFSPDGFFVEIEERIFHVLNIRPYAPDGIDGSYIPAIYLVLMPWIGIWYRPVMALHTVFLLVCGVCSLIILRQADRILDTILAGEPFQTANAKSMKRAALCCWTITLLAAIRLVLELLWTKSTQPLYTYNTLAIPVSLTAGLLFLVMSALFRQAAELQEDQDLTI